MKKAGMVDKAATLCLGLVLAGCASAPPQRVFDSTKIDLWELDKAPMLSEVITMPVEKIEDVVSRSRRADSLESKGKFETDEMFKARIANMPPMKSAFVVMPLRTGTCSSYDFAAKTYKISCPGFRLATELATDVKTTESTKLANAYTSRDVELTERTSYHLSAQADAVFTLAMSSEDAKKIDNDLMIGLVFSITRVDTALGGCGKFEITTLDDKVCKEVGFKSGMLVKTWKYTVIPNELLDVVVFRKSNQRVVRRESFAMKR